MKKLLKFSFAVASAAGMVLAVLYMGKKYFGWGKDLTEEETEDFDQVFADEVDDREYVTLDIDGETAEADEKQEASA